MTMADVVLTLRMKQANHSKGVWYEKMELSFHQLYLASALVDLKVIFAKSPTLKLSVNSKDLLLSENFELVFLRDKVGFLWT